jgi:hypothetical protein
VGINEVLAAQLEWVCAVRRLVNQNDLGTMDAFPSGDDAKCDEGLRVGLKARVALSHIKRAKGRNTDDASREHGVSSLCEDDRTWCRLSDEAAAGWALDAREQEPCGREQENARAFHFRRLTISSSAARRKERCD